MSSPKKPQSADADEPHTHIPEGVVDVEVGSSTTPQNTGLHTALKGRHMQMIAIGGAIGAGLFIGSGGALYKGGPAALIIGYLIVGLMLLLTMQSLAELAVLYPVNGAFYTYVVRFVDPSWGFAIGWDYAISWLTILPFELTAAGIVMGYWRPDLNVAIWVTVFLVLLASVQIFGVRGYGEVEFVLSLIKIIACIGFIIFGIIVNVGAVGDQGYLGTTYWRDPGAFQNGFNGFAGVFVIAAFSFAGTELVGLAAAESKNPRKSIPLATKQVFFRIFLFYIVNLFILGLIMKSTDPRLEKSSGSNSRASPFVLAIQDAGVKILPSIFNAVIAISVLSVANSCTFGSTRTLQAMADRGMAPKFLAHIDKAGRPRWCVVIQLAFGLLGYIGAATNGSVVFNWLLALSGLSNFFIWGSCCLAHIRFRLAWKQRGYDLNQIPYKAPFGIWGSAIGLTLNVVCLVATFYNVLYPTPDATPDVSSFFQGYLAAPIVVLLYLFWKVYTRNWQPWVKLSEMDLKSGARLLEEHEMEPLEGKTWRNLPKRVVRGLF